jgi:hypothetical protein
MTTKSKPEPQSKAKIKHRTGAAATINPDHVGMHKLIVAGVIVTLFAAVVTSWNGLVWVGAQQLLPLLFRPTTPVMIDVPLIVLTLARGALAKRGIDARGLLVGIFALTAFSSAANLLHTVAIGGLGSIPAALGAATNGLAPWLILAMTEVLWLVVTRQPRPSRPRAAKQPAKRSTRARGRATAPAAPPQTRAPEPTLFDEPDALAALRESAQ